METYILEDDEVGERCPGLDRQAAARRSGAPHPRQRGRNGHLGGIFQRMVDSGIQVLEFNPVNPVNVRKDWLLNQRDHRKLLIVDGRTAFLGGINISSVYSGGSFSRASRVRSGAMPLGATPICNCKGSQWPSCKGCFWRPGRPRKARPWTRKTTSPYP